MEKSRLLYVVLFHTAFASFGEIEANLLNYLTVPVRQFFADSLRQRYGIVPYSNQFEFVYSMVASIFFIGAIVGGVLMGPCMEHFGRRATAVYLRSFLGAISALFTLLSKWLTMVELFAIGHFIAGMIATWKIAMFIYLAECSPDHSRGWSTSVIGSGSSLALLFIAPLCLPSVFGTAELWWLLPAFALCLAMFHLCFAAHFPESPKHLFCGRRNATKICRERAKLSIKFYHGSSTDVFKVMDQFEQERLLTSREHSKWCDFWNIRELRNCLCVTLITSWIFAFSLTNLKSQYLESMLMRYGLTQTGAMVSTMAMIALAAPCCFLSPVLIERWGRRPLFLLITLFSTVELTLIAGAQLIQDQQQASSGSGNFATASLALIGTTLGQFSANLGIFQMTPILIGELIPHAARTPTVQINLLLASPLLFFIVIAYPPLIGILGALFFMPLALISAALLYLLYQWMPETKGLSVDTIFRRMTKLDLLLPSGDRSSTEADNCDDDENEKLIT